LNSHYNTFRNKLDEAEEKRFQLFDPEGRVMETPGANLRFIKKCCRQVKMNLSNNPLSADTI
jgi:hypothetical protein